MMMQFHIKLEGVITDDLAGDRIESYLDAVMELLVDAGLDDVTVGGTLASGHVEIEFNLTAEALADAQRLAQAIIAEVLTKAQPASYMYFQARRETTELVDA